MLEQDRTILEQRHDALGRELVQILAVELQMAKAVTEQRIDPRLVY